MQREFWNDIGRTSDDGETSRRFLPTPYGLSANQGQGDGEFGKAIRSLPHGKLISFVAASPAKTSATPEKGQDSMEHAADSSTKSPVLFAYWNPDTCCWRTSQRSLLGGWTPYSGRWPRSGMMRNGTAYRLPPLVPRISGTGCSLWRTPAASDGTHGGPNARDSSGAPHLSAQVMFPTPTDASKGGGSSRSGKRINETPTLQGMARKGVWPTHQSRDWKSGSTKSDYGNSRPLSEAVSGQLNPTWIEWLMGFPLGWTDLDAWETQ